MKKKGLVVWTTLAIISIVVLVVGFAFSGIAECVGLYTSYAEEIKGAISISSIADPIIFAYNRFFGGNFSWNWTTGLTIGILAIFVIAEICLIIALIAKKKSKYAGYPFYILVVTFLGLYVSWYVLDTTNVTPSIARQLVTSGSQYFNILTWNVTEVFETSGVANYFISVWFYVFLLGVLLTLITALGTGFTCFAYTLQTKKEAKPQPVEVKEEPVATFEAPEVKEEPTPVVKKKKVVLVVKRYDSFKDVKEPVIQKVTEYPHEKIEVKPLTIEDIRAALKDELDAREAKEKKDVNFNNEIVHEEVSTPKKEAISVSESDITKEVKETPQIPTPVIIAIPEPIKEENIKPTPKKEEVIKEPSLNKDQVRDIIRDELAKALDEIKNQEPEIEEEIFEETREVPVKVIEKIHEKIVEKPVEVEKIVEKPVEVIKEVYIEKPVETPKAEEPKVEETVVTPSEEAEAEESPKIERIPFATRIREADDEMKDNYNHIKSLLLSYGLKNRTSNGGDAFRLHKVTYCKITVAGKSLKLYLALDPNDYKNSTLPIKDASSKEIYKDIPLVFKVKSGLSLRRAEQLITEMMDKHGIEQADRVEVKDYASTLTETADDTDED